MPTVLSDSDTDMPVSVMLWHATDETRRFSALAYKPPSTDDVSRDEDDGVPSDDRVGDGGIGRESSEAGSTGGVVHGGKSNDGNFLGLDGEDENDGGEKDSDEDVHGENEDKKSKSEVEEDTACADGKRILLNNAERIRLIGWVAAQNMAPISQKAPVYMKKCRLVARQARAFVPTSEENAADEVLFGVVWRAKRAKFASAKTFVNVRRTIPGMKNKIVYNLVNSKARQVDERAGAAEGGDVEYANDCAVDKFLASKKKAMSLSASGAKDMLKKEKTDRLSSKQANFEKNKALVDDRRKQKDEKEAKAAQRNARAEKVAESVAMLAAGQAEVACHSARMSDNAVSLGDTQKDILLVQLVKMKKSSM